MQRWFGTGRLTKDVELRYTYDGRAVAKYTLACDRSKDDTDFIPCVAFGKSAEFAGKWFQKGTKVEVVGTIKTGSYENKDGKKVYTTDVWVIENTFGESKKEHSDSESVKRNEASEVGEGFMKIPEGADDCGLPFN